jgi:hypothetical protein
MVPKLSAEIRDALASDPGRPLEIEDPVTHNRYVLMQLEAYQRLRQGLDYDGSEPDTREFYPAFAEAVKADLDAPGPELYDSSTSERDPS